MGFDNSPQKADEIYEEDDGNGSSEDDNDDWGGHLSGVMGVKQRGKRGSGGG